ncbi:hypothetical protein BRC81_08820 [Halobacteriales archaeon QS_1_68_20]|nr:MAG: hypothetical protein BRC81_08820 [Halobacteriales archaeon QS_1_68_20]
MTNPPESELVHRELNTEAGNPGVQVAQAVADIDGRDATELTTIYDCVDGVLDHVFSNPPSADAQLEVTFSYEGYRITVEQGGTTTFVKVE